MFVEEMELEKRSPGTVLLVVVVALVLAVAGVAVYQLRESRNVLTVPEAANLAIGHLQARGPATVAFHVGKLVSSVADHPGDPQYRLLAKAGILKVVQKGKAYDSPALVSLTPKGEEVLKNIVGVKKTTEKDGTVAYVVPLAERKLADVTRITMTGPRTATADYSWRWESNALGEIFDAAGPQVQSFNTWDRASLINKYGADFFKAAPTRSTMALMRTDKGWEPATD